MTAEEVRITAEQARAILSMAGIRCTPSVTLIKRHNHVYHFACGTDEFFLKIYTKDWYSGDTAAPGGCVDHEASAWRTLAQQGLAVPQVMLAARSWHTCSLRRAGATLRHGSHRVIPEADIRA